MKSPVDAECIAGHHKHKKKKKHKSPKRERSVADEAEESNTLIGNDVGEYLEKKERKDKKRKRVSEDKIRYKDHGDVDLRSKKEKKRKKSKKQVDGVINNKKYFPFEYEHILAPMVGASELAFRLLCRKYGATLAYTPMMSAKQFIEEASAMKPSLGATIANSNICEFQTIPEDRPLVCHFSANNPEHFAKAASLVEPYCDAVDLNLGCPQRTAFVGHFGSYLLGDEDRYVGI